jgi:tetratricopeptide (TPR) repeat protein
MRSLTGAGASLATVAMLAFGAVGCAKVGELKSMKAFKGANQAYQQQDYKKASALYEEAVAAAPDSRPAQQSLFFLGNSYDNLYKPSRKGEADNDALLQKAVQNYQKAAEKLSSSQFPEDRKLGKLSLEYLVAAYGPDKLNDPAAAEPVVQKMIQMEPGEPTNYFQLAKIYEDAGAYDEAERVYQQAKQAKPNDPAVYMQLAGYYNRQADFDKTIDALAQRASVEPNNPEAFFTISTYYWDNAQRNATLTDAVKKEQVGRGLEAVDKALAIKGDYMEALVYKGLLLRLQATLEKDPGKQQELLKEATDLKDQAEAIKKKRSSGD